MDAPGQQPGEANPCEIGRQQPSRRRPDAAELRRTAVLALPIEEASVKVRTGGPVDDDADLGLPVWSGVIPLAVVRGEPEEFVA